MKPELYNLARHRRTVDELCLVVIQLQRQLSKANKRIEELEEAILAAPCPSWWDERQGCRYWCMEDDCKDTDQPCWKRKVMEMCQEGMK